MERKEVSKSRFKRLTKFAFVSDDFLDNLKHEMNRLFKWNGVNCSCRVCRGYKSNKKAKRLSEIKSDLSFKEQRSELDCWGFPQQSNL